MAGSTEMLAAFRELTTAKQLERSDLLDLLRDGIQAALVRKFGPNVKFELSVDELQGTIRVVRLRQVVETVEDSELADHAGGGPVRGPRLPGRRHAGGGSPLRGVRPPRGAGRQAADHPAGPRRRAGPHPRGVHLQGRASCCRGEVQQIERGKLVIMLNKFREAEAIIPYREQNHREHFHQGDTIRAVLKRLEETPKGPRLILSRGDPLFVKALFKLEVPEIQQQIVEIRAIAREVGSRTKVAVISRDDAIDPVGACVGLKGSRVQAVVNELGGERIDIVPWSPDPERFARLALAPARVAKVFSDPEAKTIQAVVDEDQLSLAIGRNGQNVRLASELTGWKIDLYSSREWLERGGEGPLFAPLPPEEEMAAQVPLSELQGAVARAHRDPGERRLQDAQRHPRSRARGHRQDPGDDARRRPTSSWRSSPSSPTRTGGEESRRQGMSGLLGLIGLGYRGRHGDRRRRCACGRSCRRESAGAWWWRRMPARAPWTRWSGWRRRRASRCCRDRAPQRSARSWESRR